MDEVKTSQLKIEKDSHVESDPLSAIQATMGRTITKRDSLIRAKAMYERLTNSKHNGEKIAALGMTMALTALISDFDQSITLSEKLLNMHQGELSNSMGTISRQVQETGSKTQADWQEYAKVSGAIRYGLLEDFPADLSKVDLNKKIDHLLLTKAEVKNLKSTLVQRFGKNITNDDLAEKLPIVSLPGYFLYKALDGHWKTED